jgi:hypothetical protein
MDLSARSPAVAPLRRVIGGTVRSGGEAQSAGLNVRCPAPEFGTWESVTSDLGSWAAIAPGFPSPKNRAWAPRLGSSSGRGTGPPSVPLFDVILSEAWRVPRAMRSRRTRGCFSGIGGWPRHRGLNESTDSGCPAPEFGTWSTQHSVRLAYRDPGHLPEATARKRAGKLAAPDSPARIAANSTRNS